MKDETLINAFMVISGVFGATAVISFILFLPLEIVAGVFLVAVAAAVVAIALAIFAIRKQERRYQNEGRKEATQP
jgi:phosphotransferase system  glucose/maltose/N-acetylglucosamine-specific IIC component